MIHTFAAIYIGSYEVSIKIFEISGKKKIRDIDYIRSRMSSEEMHIPREVSDMNLWRRCVIRLPSTKDHGRLPGGQLRSVCCRSLEKR